MSDAKYHWNPEIQMKIVALLARDMSFATTYGEVVQSEYFENEVAMVLAHLVLFYTRSYHCTPTKPVLIDMLDVYCRQYQTPPEIKSKFSAGLHTLYELDLSDYPYIRERVIEFGQRQAIKLAMKTSVEKLKNDEWDLTEIRMEFDRALNLGQGLDDLGYELFARNETLASYLQGIQQYRRSAKVPTFLPKMNKELFGGLGPGELAVLAGLPKKGKSIFMTNMGYSGIRNGLQVFHYSLELKESDLVMRYIMRIMGYDVRQVLEYPHVCQEFIRSFFQFYAASGFNPGVHCKYFSPGSAGVSHIRTHLSRVCSITGVPPGLIIIDYPDLMKNERPVSRENSDGYSKMGDIYMDIIRLADDYKVPIWVPSQIHRIKAAEKPRLFTIHNLADSFKKAMHADVLCTLNQDDDQAAMHPQRAIVYIAGGRRGADNMEINCVIDKSKMYFAEDSSVGYTNRYSSN